MDASSYLAQALGIYLSVVGLALLLRGERVWDAMEAMIASPGLRFASAVGTLLLGAFLVPAHNVWVADWPVIITVFAWAALLKGAVRVTLPELDPRMLEAARGRIPVFVPAAATLVAGLYLGWMGFRGA